MPSAWSALAPATPWRCASSSSARSRSMSQARSSACFVEARAPGRQAGQPDGDGPRRRDHLVGGDDRGDQPEALGVGRGQRVGR